MLIGRFRYSWDGRPEAGAVLIANSVFGRCVANITGTVSVYTARSFNMDKSYVVGNIRKLDLGWTDPPAGAVHIESSPTKITNAIFERNVGGACALTRSPGELLFSQFLHNSYRALHGNVFSEEGCLHVEDTLFFANSGGAFSCWRCSGECQLCEYRSDITAGRSMTRVAIVWLCGVTFKGVVDLFVAKWFSAHESGTFCGHVCEKTLNHRFSNSDSDRSVW